MGNLILLEKIESKIFFIRKRKVMIDRDLAELYGTETKVLNQAVKRNIGRFPDDFMFRLNLSEMNELVTNCDRFALLKHSVSFPYAFTEQGVAMLSSVLKSERAIEVNIMIMRVFVRLKEMAFSYKELAEKLKELEIKYDTHDDKIMEIFKSLDFLMEGEKNNNKIKEIGFGC